MAEGATQAAARGRPDLTNGPIGSTLIAFALPTLGSSILQSLNGSINSVWVGRFLGEDALAATSNANLIMFLMFSFVFGFGMAATILVGQAFGRRDLDAARRAVGTAVGSLTLLATVIAVLGYFGADGILRLLATPGEAFGLAHDYLNMIFLAIPPAMLMVTLMMALRGGGDAMTPLWFMCLAVLLDCGLNPIFILGLGPAPEMGIAGAGFATAVANYVSVAAMIGYIYAKDLPLRLRGPELGYLKPDGALLRTMVGKGFPMGLQMIVITTSAMAMIGLVNREGVQVTAAYGVTQQLWTYVQMPAMAIGAAVSAMVAQNIGAGRWDRVGAITRSGLIYAALLTAVLVVVLTIFDRPLVALFLGGDSAAIPIAQHIQLLATWNFIMFGVTLVLFSTVRANGSVIGPLIILAIAMYPVRLGFALSTYDWLGMDALWLSFPIGSIAAAALATAFYLHGGWRKTRMAVPPPSEDECIEQAHATGEPGGALNPTG